LKDYYPPEFLSYKTGKHRLREQKTAFFNHLSIDITKNALTPVSTGGIEAAPVICFGLALFEAKAVPTKIDDFDAPERL